LDLGAGQCEIGRSLVSEQSVYKPTDQHPKGDAVCLDFTDMKKVHEVIHLLKPVRIISLFALDVVMPTLGASNVIRECLSHECVEDFISAGFYYNDGRKHQLTVEEVGGLISHQVQARSNISDGILHETRLEVPAPSEMFGESVIEVWRHVRRNSR